MLLLLHAGNEPARFVLPGPAWASGWRRLLDTFDERPAEASWVDLPGEPVTMAPRSVVLLRAEQPGPPA